jgi:hypothetical protein
VTWFDLIASLVFAVCISALAVGFYLLWEKLK